MLNLECPHCGERLRVPENYAGTTGFCKGCKKSIAVPSLAKPVENQQQPTAFEDLQQQGDSAPPHRPVEIVHEEDLPRSTEHTIIAHGCQIQQAGCAMTGCGCLLLLFAILLAGLAGAAVPVSVVVFGG